MCTALCLHLVLAIIKVPHSAAYLRGPLSITIPGEERRGEEHTAENGLGKINGAASGENSFPAKRDVDVFIRRKVS